MWSFRLFSMLPQVLLPEKIHGAPSFGSHLDKGFEALLASTLEATSTFSSGSCLPGTASIDPNLLSWSIARQ
ncbi:hypothetical protein BDQ12DRAFT_135311 [Crucibulum laeve]|uniref:Uncharacterized protein n=1 Tax=Crucibulum laeve TaxID=68775 RepID=A0A5C3LY32_9AGAR|nr:hypothetical protein BDQ12DRAFT_135311 [Crucibulum laeve]